MWVLGSAYRTRLEEGYPEFKHAEGVTEKIDTWEVPPSGTIYLNEFDKFVFIYVTGKDFEFLIDDMKVITPFRNLYFIKPRTSPKIRLRGRESLINKDVTIYTPPLSPIKSFRISDYVINAKNWTYEEGLDLWSTNNLDSELTFEIPGEYAFIEFVFDVECLDRYYCSYTAMHVETLVNDSWVAVFRRGMSGGEFRVLIPAVKMCRFTVKAKYPNNYFRWGVYDIADVYGIPEPYDISILLGAVIGFGVGFSLEEATGRW